MTYLKLLSHVTLFISYATVLCKEVYFQITAQLVVVLLCVSAVNYSHP